MDFIKVFVLATNQTIIQNVSVTFPIIIFLFFIFFIFKNQSVAGNVIQLKGVQYN